MCVRVCVCVCPAAVCRGDATAWIYLYICHQKSHMLIWVILKICSHAFSRNHPRECARRHRLTHITGNHCLTSETQRDFFLFSICIFISNEGSRVRGAGNTCFIQRNTSPHTKSDISPFLLFFLFTHCFSEIKTKGTLDITNLDFKAGTRSHMRAEEGKHAEWHIPDRECM